MDVFVKTLLNQALTVRLKARERETTPPLKDSASPNAAIFMI
jgi:hypothetical protein